MKEREGARPVTQPVLQAVVSSSFGSSDWTVWRGDNAYVFLVHPELFRQLTQCEEVAMTCVPCQARALLTTHTVWGGDNAYVFLVQLVLFRPLTHPDSQRHLSVQRHIGSYRWLSPDWRVAKTGCPQASLGSGIGSQQGEGGNMTCGITI